MHWILLRGLTREQAHWGGLPDCLSQRYPGHRFHCVDLPGTGEHLDDRSPATITGIRRRVQAYAASISGPLGLLGLSMGGMVALDWAQAEPDRIATLLLINTSTGFSPPWRRMRPAALGQVLRMPLVRDVSEREQRILQLTSSQRITPELVSAWSCIQRRRPVTVATTLAQLGAAARYRPDSRPPAAGGLLLASAGDAIVHWRCSQDLARRWGWPLLLHPDAGHDLPLDAPEWILDQFQTVA